MAISNNGELKTAIYRWSNKDNLTAVAPDFITLAQERITNDIIKNGGSRHLEDSTAITSTTAVSLPSDLLSIRSVSVAVNGVNRELRPISINMAQRSAGLPVDYYMQAGAVNPSPVADASYVYTVAYIKKLAAFSADSDTDSILENHASLYLYACLLEASIYLKDVQKASAYQIGYNERMSSFLGVDKNRFSNMSVRVA